MIENGNNLPFYLYINIIRSQISNRLLERFVHEEQTTEHQVFHRPTESIRIKRSRGLAAYFKAFKNRKAPTNGSLLMLGAVNNVYPTGPHSRVHCGCLSAVIAFNSTRR